MAAEGTGMGADELRHPPRWADALLRLLLDPEKAESYSGDLLEAYRDSIVSLRGRWRADLWFVSQVLSCVLLAGGMKLRNWLLAGLALCFLTIVFSILMYPGLLSAPAMIGIAAGILIYGYVAAVQTRSVTPGDSVILRLGTRYGLAIGALWIANNALWIADYINTRLPGRGLLLPAVAFVLPVVAGFHGAAKLCSVRAGIRTGFWSGLISGLVVCFWMMTMGYIHAFIPGLPGEILSSQYQRANVGETLGFGLVHLFVIGGIFSVIGGTLGGVAGISGSVWSVQHPELWGKANFRRWFLIRDGLVAFVVAGLAIVVLVNVLTQQMSPPAAKASSPAAAPLQTAAEYLARGDEYFDRRDYAGALADYSHAIELNPNFAGAYNNRAYAYMMMNNYAPALADLDVAIQLRPTYVNALMKRGDIHGFYYQVDRKLAIADYDRIIALGPEAYLHNSVCGHRLVVQHNGLSAGLWFSLIFRGALRGNIRSAGCFDN